MAYSSHRSDALDVTPGRGSQNNGLAKSLLASAKDFEAYGDGEQELGNVWSFLVLALLELVKGNVKTTWITIGQTLYVVASLELLLSPSTQTQRSSKKGLKRTILECIAREILIAFRLRVRPCFCRSNIQDHGPVQTEGIEEWEPWQPRQPRQPRLGSGKRYSIAYTQPSSD